MQITAKFNSRCPVCKGLIDVGSTVEWTRGEKAKHPACANGSAASAAAPASLPSGHSGHGVKPRGRGTNKRGGHCTGCGVYLAPYTGRLYKCIPDGDCMEHFDSDEGGWHVCCLDETACKENRAKRKAEATIAATAAKTKAAQDKLDREACESRLKVIKADFEARGMEMVSCGPPEGVTMTDQGAVLFDSGKHLMYDTTIRDVTLSDGSQVLMETANSYDDWRTYYWLPKAGADAWRLSYAAKAGITVEQSRVFMAEYSGCSGADIHKAVLAAADFPTDPRRRSMRRGEGGWHHLY